MAVHLVNPSHLSFGIGVITPRWLFVLAAATPGRSSEIGDRNHSTTERPRQPSDRVRDRRVALASHRCPV